MTNTTTNTITNTTVADAIQLVTIGDGVGLILPPSMLAKLGVKDGDKLSVEMTPSGIRLTPDTLAIARRVMREDKDLLRRLAE